MQTILFLKVRNWQTLKQKHTHTHEAISIIKKAVH